MKQFIRKWLYITKLSSDFYEEKLGQQSNNLRLEEKILELNNRVKVLEEEARFAYGILNGLLDHLGVDYYKGLEPDFQVLPPEPRMREVIKIRKKLSQRAKRTSKP